MTQDELYMKRALTLARRGVGTTYPNPAVGCVIVKEGVIIGEGWHKRAGGHHAEVHALAMAGSNAAGADVYVTLEPCSHTGRTPPCCDALLRAGVARVFIGSGDPNPRVNGNGIHALQQAGITTVVGLLEEKCQELNRAFMKFMATGRPHTIMKCAMSLDGKIASATGDSRWISCEASRTLVHRLRATCKAIMVGVGTVIADDPRLTVRHVTGNDPLRIVVDSHLRTPEHAALLSADLAPGTLIATTESAPEHQARFLARGMELVVCKSCDGKVDLGDLWDKLGTRGIQSLLLEGGSRLAGEALKRGLINECVFFYAPKVVGADGISPFGISGSTTMAEAIPFSTLKSRRVGTDIMVTAYPENRCLQD